MAPTALSQACEIGGGRRHEQRWIEIGLWYVSGRECATIKVFCLILMQRMQNLLPLQSL